MVDLEANVLSYGTVNSSSSSRSRRVLRGFLYGVAATALLAVTCAVGLVLFNGDRSLPFATLEQFYNPLTGSLSSEPQAVAIPTMSGPVFKSATGTAQLADAAAAAPAAPAPAGKNANGKNAAPNRGKRGSAKVDRWFNPITGEISYEKPKSRQPRYGKAMYGYAASVPEIDDRKAPADDSPKLSAAQSAKKFWEGLGLGDQYVPNPNYNPRYNPGGADADLAGKNGKKAAQAAGTGATTAGAGATTAAAGAAPAAPGKAAAYAMNQPQLAFKPNNNVDDNSELAIAERDEEAAAKAAAQAQAFQRVLAKQAKQSPKQQLAANPPEKAYSQPQPQPMYAPAPGVSAAQYPRSEQREIVQPQISTGLFQPARVAEQQQPRYVVGAPMVRAADDAPAAQNVEYAAPMQQYSSPQESNEGPELMEPPMNPELAARPPQMQDAVSQNQVETVAEADSQYSPGYTE